VSDLLTRVQKILSNRFLYDYLQWKYKAYPLLKRGGIRYPLVVFPAASPQIYDPESVLHFPLIKTSPGENDFVVRDAGYRRLLEKTGKKIENRPTFIIHSLHTSGKISLHCMLGNYYDGLDTCYALEWELTTAIAKKSVANSTERVLKNFDAGLPWRAKTNLHCADPVKWGSGRSAFIGISVLICYRDGNDYHLWLQKRSDSTVTSGAGLYHVIPSFVFQPASGFPDQEYSILHNLKREYLEELFHRAEPGITEGDCRYFYNDKRLLYLEKLITDEQAGIYLSGIAVNLLNLRPEICLLLIISSKAWYSFHSQNESSEQRFDLNTEWAPLTQIAENESESIGRLPVNYTDEVLCDKFRLGPGRITPAGAAALWLGLDLLRNLGFRS
jgi:hypothetical protein